MASPNCFVSVCLFFMNEGGILFLLRQNTDYGEGLYGVPGGGILKNERLTQAAIRIAKEQLGVEVREEDLELATIVHISEGKHPNEIAFYYFVRQHEGTISNCRPHKCRELRFFPLNDLPTNLMDVQAMQNLKEKRLMAETLST